MYLYINIFFFISIKFYIYIVLTQLTNQRNAIKMLTDRIKVLYKYIEDVEAGKFLK